MAGDWIKMECCTPEKSEVLAITARLGWDDADLTVGKLFRLWRWFDQHTADGNATGVTAALLDRIVGVTGFCEALTQVGWLTLTEHGVSLPNFDRHNGNTAKNRAQTAKRVAKFKANAKGNATDNAAGNAGNVTEALPREEKRREEVIPPKSPKGESLVLPDWMPVEAWSGFAEMRRRIKKPMTARAAKLIVSALERMKAKGFDVAEILDNSTRNGWQDVYEPKASVVAKISPVSRHDPEYPVFHKDAAWWRDAGFESVWDAMANQCFHNNAGEFRDGQRVRSAA